MNRRMIPKHYCFDGTAPCKCSVSPLSIYHFKTEYTCDRSKIDAKKIPPGYECKQLFEGKLHRGCELRCIDGPC